MSCDFLCFPVPKLLARGLAPANPALVQNMDMEFPNMRILKFPKISASDFAGGLASMTTSEFHCVNGVCDGKVSDTQHTNARMHLDTSCALSLSPHPTSFLNSNDPTNGARFLHPHPGCQGIVAHAHTQGGYHQIRCTFTLDTAAIAQVVTEHQL